MLTQTPLLSLVFESLLEMKTYPNIREKVTNFIFAALLNNTIVERKMILTYFFNIFIFKTVRQRGLISKQTMNFIM